MENKSIKTADFISYIAHELRAPLATMKWSTEMLLDGTLGQLEKFKHAAGEKGRMARWQLNMRRGKQNA